MIHLAIDGFTGVACSFIRTTKVTQYAKVRDDRREWAAKFVAEDGQEVVLRPVGRRGFARCTFESLFRHRQFGILTLALLDEVAVGCSDPRDDTVNHDEGGQPHEVD